MGFFDELLSGGRNIVNQSGLSGLTNPFINSTIGLPLASANLLSGNGLMGNQNQGGSSNYSIPGSSSGNRDQDFASGRAIGQQVFYSPEMQESAGRLKDLSKGYSGQELGALKGQADRELEGQRGGYLRQLQGKAAQGGIGGARLAAMQGAADKGFAANKADNERKILASNAGLVREGNKDYTNFLMNQRYGELGTGLGYAQLGAGERAGQAQMAIANKEPKRGFLGQLTQGLF